MSVEHVFRVENLEKSFRKNRVLQGISLEVRQGEILGLIGQSGSGKTTLLHTMIGFLKPDRGSVQALIEPPHRALGKPTYKDVYGNMNQVKQMYGFASQIPSFYDTLTVRENMEYFGSLYDLPSQTLKTNAELLLHLMDLGSAQGVLAKNLSGGMERRLDIACALMHDPAVLILDEPTADLDPILRSHIYDLIKKINVKNTTIVLASHHLSDIEHVCDRIAILSKGKIMVVGSPSQIKDKYMDSQQIRIQTDKHDYSQLMDEIRHLPVFLSVDVDGHELVISTRKIEEGVKELMGVVERHRQKIVSMHVARPSLDDIFVKVFGGEHE